MKRTILSVLVAASLMAFASTGTASAAVTLSQANSGSLYQYGSGVAVTISDYSYSVDANAGGFLLTTQPGNPLASFVAWCLDIRTYLDLPEQYNVTNTPFSQTSGTIGATQLANIQKLFNTGLSLVNSATTSAGFQLALWELLYEDLKPFDVNGYGSNNGNFDVTGNNTSSVRSFANQLLANLSGPVTQAYQLVFYESVGGRNNQQSQNLVSVTPVPIPAAGLMLGAGLVGLFAMKRNKKRNAAA